MVISWEFSWMRFGFQIRYAYQVPGLMYTYFPRYLGIVCLTFSSVSVTQSAHLLLYMGTYDPVFTSTLTVLESRILESDDERTSNVKVVKVEFAADRTKTASAWKSTDSRLQVLVQGIYDELRTYHERTDICILWNC